MMRGFCAAVCCPKFAVVWNAAALKFAVVLSALNCVWLNALYISSRNWNWTLSRMGMPFTSEMFPVFQARAADQGLRRVPSVPTAGGAKTVGLVLTSID